MRATVLLSFGLMANLATQMTFAATLHEIAADLGLDASDSGWIGGIYFTGYAVAVPVLGSATDRIDGRWLYGGAQIAVAASFPFAAFAHGFAVALVLRFLGGIGLAGVHMPGLNLLMDRVDRTYQGRAAGIYASSYAAGTAGSFLLAGVVDEAFGWRATFIAAGIGPLLSLGYLALLPAPIERKSSRPRPPYRALRFSDSPELSDPADIGEVCGWQPAIGRLCQAGTVRSYIPLLRRRVAPDVQLRLILLTGQRQRPLAGSLWRAR